MAIDVQLNGTVRSATPATSLWTVVPPSANVTFVDDTDPDTIAHITVAGDYVLKLTATNGEFTAFDTMTIQAHANTAPNTNAGPDRTAVVGNPITLAGSATDDGYPNPPGALTYTWSKTSGSGTVTFSPSANVATPTASFSAADTYVLQLQASDSLLTDPTPDTCSVVVSATPQGHYVSATPDTVSGSVALTDVEFLVDMSAFGASWWAAAQTSSAGVRVTTSNSAVLLPCDVIHYDATAKTGFLVYKRDTAVGGAGEEVRIWTGPTSGAVALAADDTNGQYNAYGSDCMAFFPDGGYNMELDRTRNQITLNNTGTVTRTAEITFDGSTITASKAGAGASATIVLAGYTVVATDVGRVLLVTGGTAFTVGRYSVSSVNTGANSWTMNSNIVTGAASGMTGATYRPAGNLASTYTGNACSFAQITADGVPCTLSAVTMLEGVASGAEHCLVGLAVTNGGVKQSADYSIRVSCNGSSEDCLATIRDGNDRKTSTAAKFGTALKQYGANFGNTGIVTASTLQATGTPSSAPGGLSNYDQVVLGAFPKLSPNENFLGDGSFTASTNTLSLVSAWNTEKHVAYLKYREQMLDQTQGAGFWNVWTYT